MKIYFELGKDELNEPNPPLAITVAKALIEISLDSASNFGKDDLGQSEWLDEIGEHLHAYTRTTRGHIVRERRRLRDEH